MRNNFRHHHPKRTCNKVYADYGDYKPYLATDFKNRCGYTDCSDMWFGGKNNFHIDHFIPWKKYPKKPNLKTDYSNLVYACSHVNILKSNDEGNYIDPCNVDFNQHFYRDRLGNILPVSSSKFAIYMHSHLKLFIARYQIIWMLEKLYIKMKKLKLSIEATPDGALKKSLQITQAELANLFLEYLTYLESNQ